MDIQKKDSSNSISKFVLIALVLFNISFNAFADGSAARKKLIDSYRLPEKLTEKRLKEIVSDLQNSLTGFDDNELVFRIRYRIGILYFKAGHIDRAGKQFHQISQEPNCPQLVRLCSLNMTGQISRMLAKDNEAIENFCELLRLSEKYLLDDNEDTILSTLLKLTVTAAFQCAEIYQYQQNYDAAIIKYKRLLGILEKNKQMRLKRYITLAKDRISQLSLMSGADYLDQYYGTAQDIIQNFPDYYRVPIIKLEVEAIKFLRKNTSQNHFPNGSFDAPVKIITYLKDCKDKVQIRSIFYVLENLCREYDGTYGAVLLNYHYACLLDATGDKEKAANTFAKITLSTAQKLNVGDSVQAVIKIIAEYAKLQQAVILGEIGNYQQAIKAVENIKMYPESYHLSKLVESVVKSLETLKREVPKR